ncbi:hypothetical protein QBC45DRAFT_452444 [Copromyces sp. CBS 386.78]|nr:hypothetical protein QBC45DRAFT_452444 [Copromyces sp. CBS 386.78]
MSGSTKKFVYGLQVQGVRQRRRRGRSRNRVHEFMTRRASGNGREEETKARRVDLSGVFHKSAGGGGEVERQTSRGEDLQEDDVAEGAEGVASLNRRGRRKG